MLEFAVDILVLGLLTVLGIELIKSPIKAVLEKKGLKDNSMAAKIFKALTLLFSYVGCFAMVILYFHFYLHENPFADIKILWYVFGVIGSSQSIYGALETYGRDGVLALLKQFFANLRSKGAADMTKLTEEGLSDFANKIWQGIDAYYEDAPISIEDIIAILKTIK